MNNETFDIHPVDASRWTDMERLFESRGGPHPCWCMVWRRNEFAKSMPGKAGRKAAMKTRVDAGVPVGLLAYADGAPVAWCSVAPKATHRPPGAPDFVDGVWSLVCFFISRPFRGHGLTERLIRAAADHARAEGARWLEAYPVAPEAPSYRFMGFVPVFERAGFAFVEPAGKRRGVMRLPL